MNVQEYNSLAWDKQVEKKIEWSIPVSSEIIEKARRGNWSIVLTPVKPVPREWFGEVKNKDILCLASGGGQQAPVLAAAGANVTVFDNSEKQLEQDRFVAARDNLKLRIEKGNAADLSRFSDESFDLIFHPCSNCFMPRLEPIWQECFRVLRRGGSLLVGFTKPEVYIFDSKAENEEGVLRVKHSLPYSDLDSIGENERAEIIANGRPLEFSHTLEEQIGGQIAQGFVITGFYEDYWHDEANLFNKYMPALIGMKSDKPERDFNLPNISETLKQAAEILRSCGVTEPRREANSLLAFALQKDRTFLIAHSKYELSAGESARFSVFLRRRADLREPLQYITGKQEFYGLEFAVTKDVLIPRPETELIVENAIETLRGVENPRFCEVGTGSGCISVSILHTVETALAIGLDISEKALQITERNAETHRVLSRLNLKISNVFNALENERFDLIASNPPYISSRDLADLQPEVRDFEPHTALTDGRDGFSIIEKIVVESPKYLKPGGYLLMEIGFDQASRVQKMFDGKTWESFEILPDLQGIPRTVKAAKAKSEKPRRENKH